LKTGGPPARPHLKHPSPSDAHAARDYVWAAGSSTVFPFATRTAENFAKKTGKKAPKVESLGTGGGIKMFCGGMGEKFPDIANASRPMKKSEFEACKAKGVKDIVEIKIGFDGIVVAMDKKSPDYNFKVEHLYLGLGQTSCAAASSCQPLQDLGRRRRRPAGQPHPGLWPAAHLGHPRRLRRTGHRGRRQAKFPTLEARLSDDEKGFKAKVDPLRTDGAWVDAGENDNAIVGTIEKTPGAVGVFGYSLPRRERQPHQGRQRQRREAHGPDHRQRPVSAVALALHLRQEGQVGVTPGLKEFVAEFVSDSATGRGGYLQGRGLIPLPPAQHEAQKGVVASKTTMGRPAS
jgi:phosphate transport system substrate-binding protein